MKSLTFLFLVLINNFSTLALDLKVKIWERELCEAPKICLPQPLSQTELVHIPEPPMNSFSRVEFYLNGYRMLFTLTKKDGETPYTSFQTELFDLSGTLLTLCSRYESIATREDFMVGACGAKMPEENKLLGVSLLVP